jgi:tetratricopeptide (TPR) repeat protein
MANARSSTGKPDSQEQARRLDRQSRPGGLSGRTSRTAGVRLIMAPLFVTALLLAAPFRLGAAADPLQQCQDSYAAGDLEASRQAAEAALAADPDSYEAAWMLSRVLIDLGNRAPEKRKRQDLYEAAERAARRAVKLNVGDTWGHHYLAASVGKLALFHGGKKKIELSKEVRDEATRAVELDPLNHRSWHILARWNREVANLSAIKKTLAKIVYGGVPKGASEENAVEYFLKAIEIAPEHVNHHLELGITYMDMKRYEDAVSEFETVLALPDSDPNDPDYKREARELLTKAERKSDEPREDKSR